MAGAGTNAEHMKKPAHRNCPGGVNGFEVAVEAILSRSALPRPDHSTADCYASREAFDAGFRVINERRDISPTAKLVHAHLVTLHRTSRAATQSEIGEAIGCSRHQVWRAVGELVTAGLVQTIRYGLGRPNGYVLLGVAEDDLNGRASASRPRRPVVAGHAGIPARAVNSSKKDERRTGYTGPDFAAQDYYATREGRLKR